MASHGRDKLIILVFFFLLKTQRPQVSLFFLISIPISLFTLTRLTPMMFQTFSDMLHSSTLTAAHFWPSLQLPLITAVSTTQLKLVSPK